MTKIRSIVPLLLAFIGPCFSQVWMGPGGPGRDFPWVADHTLASTVKPTLLMGKVALEDGSPSPQSATVQGVCHGVVQAQGYTDPKGYFSIQLNRSVPAFAGDTREQMTGALFLADDCELRAEVPGFVSQSVRLSITPADTGIVDAGTILLYPSTAASGYTVSATTLAAPKDAQRAFEKGREEEKKGKWASARDKFLKAVQTYPRYALAWFELGRVQKHEGNLNDARQSFHEALAADSHFVVPYTELAQIAVQEKRWQEVAETTGQLLQLDPVSFPQYWFLNSAANYNLKKVDQAEKAVLRGMHLDVQQRIPEMHYLLAAILVHKHDYHGAAEHVRDYLALAPQAPNAPEAQRRLRELEKLAADLPK
jgi:tetratricopeptide (TPR) repeat protein